MLQDMFTLTGRWNRLNRQRFFGYGLLQAILVIVLFSIVIIELLSGGNSLALFLPILGVVSVVGIWMNLCLSVKRLHDLDKSGWYFLVYLIPIVGSFFIFYLWFAKGIEGDNQYGPDPLAQV